MPLYPFLSRVVTRRVSAKKSSSFAVLTLGGLTLCVAGLLAFSSLNPPVRAAQQEEVSRDEIPPEPGEIAEPLAEERRVASISKLREVAIVDVQAAASRVSAPDPQALAKALGIESGQESDEGSEANSSRLEQLGDLDGDGIPEMALKWTRLPRPTPVLEGEGAPPLGWVLFLLAWDGARWRPTHLTDGAEPLSLQVLPLLGPATQELAVLVSVGAAAVPYPVIFQFKNHAAILLWDGRADESRYQGYAYGKVEFRDVNDDGVLELEVSGRADPGVLNFPRQGARGFEAKAVYVWDGKAYVPGKTEYSANEDYTLYRFISALHLHDFRSAYELIDPAKFLRTQEPSLEAFKKQVEGTWPEFLDDNIFEARDPGEGTEDDYSFTLQLEGRLHVYEPTFSRDSKHLLTGLERRGEK